MASTDMNPIPHHRTTAHTAANGRQAGFSLIVALIFLVVLSLLAVATVRTVMTSTRMAGNTQDWNVAFQAAEAALRDGEQDVITQQRTGYSSACGNGLCYPTVTVGSPPVWSTETGSPLAGDSGWTSGGSSSGPSVAYGAYTHAAALSDPANPGRALPIQPRYIIEDLGAIGGSVTLGGGYPPPVSAHAYRVTAVGFGKITSLLGTPTSRVVLQSIITH